MEGVCIPYHGFVRMLSGPLPPFLREEDYYVFKIEHDVNAFVYGIRIRTVEREDSELYPNEVMIVPRDLKRTTCARRNRLRLIIKMMGTATRNVYGLRMITPIPHTREQDYVFLTKYGRVEYADIVKRLEFMMYVCDMKKSSLLN
jgi:hypothetical protein